MMHPSLCVSECVCVYASVFVIAFLVYVCVTLDMRPPALMREDSGLDPHPTPFAQLDLTPRSVRRLLMRPRCDMPPSAKERHKSSSFFSPFYPSASRSQPVTSARRS